LLNHLTGVGHSAETIVSLSLMELNYLPIDDEGGKLRLRYLERRPVVAPVRPDALAFVDAKGAPLKVDGFAAYVAGLRRVGVNAEFNGALCRGLLSVRFDLETPLAPRSKASSNSPDSQHVP
jgi:hypothetical protein